MEPIGIAQMALTGLLAAVTAWLVRSFTAFAGEQREANRANSLASRSMQRDVLYRYFRVIVEDGGHVTPEEWSHVEECYVAYHANGGNGAGTLMFEKMRACVQIDTGRGDSMNAESMRAIVTLLVTVAVNAANAAGFALDFGALYNVAFSVASAAAVAYAWWRNQNVTEAAQAAQEYLDGLNGKGE